MCNIIVPSLPSISVRFCLVSEYFRVCLQGTLSVLNVSGNHLTSLSDLESLSELTQLFATDNHLSDMKEMAQLTSSWRRLTRIDLVNNPICQRARYRDRIIVMAPHLGKWTG